MDKVGALFGNIQVFKTGTVFIEKLNQKQDVYVAKLKNSTTNKIGLIVFVPHNRAAMQYSVVKQLDWSSFHVRSYATEKNFIQAMKKIANEEQVYGLDYQPIPNVDWGNDQDVVLTTQIAKPSSSVYDGDVPFAVTLHSAYSDNKFGSELEHEIELIPALQTYNFTLSK